MREKLLLAYGFMVMNFAAVTALVYYVRGRRDVWLEPGDRRDAFAAPRPQASPLAR